MKQNPTIPYVQENIRSIRKELGYNIKDFSSLLGVSNVTIWNYERGQSKAKREQCEILIDLIKSKRSSHYGGNNKVLNLATSNVPLASTTSKEVKFSDGLYTIYTTTIYVKHL